MATTAPASDKTQAAPSDQSPDSVKSDVPEVSADDVKKVQEDPRFDLPMNRVRTAEDAYQAYLREEIDESELRAVVSAYGTPKFSALKSNLERPDNAFERTVPEDLYDDPSLKVTDVKDRLKAIEERDKAAEKATKEAEEEQKKSKASA